MRLRLRSLTPARARNVASSSAGALARGWRAFARLARIALSQVALSLREVPRAAWVCALVAFLNAVSWSFITPPFQAPDEPSHFAYVQQLVETRGLPSGSARFSQEEETVLRDLHHFQVRNHPENHPLTTQAEQRHLEEDLAEPLHRCCEEEEGAGVAASQPPLYYALEAIPYGLGSGGNVLDRLELMRLLSALMGGLTALFSYLFVREALPGVPWAWVVGGLGVALTAPLAAMSGVVNPDAMLFAASAAIFYLLARGFRRGLTPGLAVAIGAVTAVGLLTKLNFIGLVPGIIAGLVVLAVRAARTSRPAALRALALAVGIGASPVLVYFVVNLFSNHARLGIASSGIHLTGERGSIFHEISYIWQFYLPRLPGMAHDFPGLSMTRDVWFNRSVGLYGWSDTSFPLWVDNLALIAAALLALLGVRALIAVRATLRRRLVELLVFAVMAGGVMALVAADAYINVSEAGSYLQPRYLLPLLPLVGAALVLSARGAGRRFGPVAGVLIVVLFFAHNLFSQLQVISRFYG